MHTHTQTDLYRISSSTYLFVVLVVLALALVHRVSFILYVICVSLYFSRRSQSSQSILRFSVVGLCASLSTVCNAFIRTQARPGLRLLALSLISFFSVVYIQWNCVILFWLFRFTERCKCRHTNAHKRGTTFFVLLFIALPKQISLLI